MSNHWTPPTFADADPDGLLGERIPCDRCDREVWPWVLQDMRGLPGVAEDFLCDGCRSDMHRHKIPVDGGSKPATRAEWRTRLLKAHGAPDHAVAAAEALERNDRRKY